MIASKTRPRARGAEPFRIVSAIACAALTLAVSAPVFAQTPDPAAAARAKAEAERKARCDPPLAAYRQHSQQFKSANAQAQTATNQYNAASDAYNKTREAYVAVRDSGEHLRAWQMMPGVDQAWARLGSAGNQVLAARTAALAAGRSACAAVSNLAAAGCMSSEQAGRCAAAMNLEGHTTGVGDARSRVTRLSKTWKTAADEKLNPANAQKGCPIAKTIAPRAVVTAVGGRVWIVRGGRTIPATVGGTLHSGDVVSVEEGGNTSIDLFSSGIIRISEKTKFEIPNPATAPPPPGIAAKAWAEAKRLIQGELYEVKTPTACTGSRG